jgi:hypothetical protein
MNYTLTLSKEDLLVLGKALGQLPYESVVLLIQKINTELKQQEDALKEKEG